MGLAARAIEAQGVATVALSIVREMTERTPSPRALFVHFPFGHALGKPGDRNEQFAVLLAALQLLFQADHPGTVRDAGFHWRRDSHPPPNWEALRTLEPAVALPRPR